MARKDWYTVNIAPPPANSFLVLKFNDNFEHETTYTVSREGVDAGACDCFAGLAGKFCRHKQVIPIFEDAKAFNTGRLYSFDKQKWYDPPKTAGALINLDELEM